MPKAPDIDKGFKLFLNHLYKRRFKPLLLDDRDSQDELQDMLLDAYTDGFYAGREYEAELIEESEDE